MRPAGAGRRDRGRSRGKLDRYIANLLDMARIEAGRDPAA